MIVGSASVFCQIDRESLARIEDKAGPAGAVQKPPDGCGLAPHVDGPGVAVSDIRADWARTRAGRISDAAVAAEAARKPRREKGDMRILLYRVVNWTKVPGEGRNRRLRSRRSWEAARGRNGQRGGKDVDS
jgi:hypothetical protein